MRSDTSKMALKLITTAVRVMFRGVTNISTGELHELMKANGTKETLVLLDVRDEKEFKVSHLPGAHNINPSSKDMEEVIHRINELATPGGGPKKIVCYCSVGYRSSTLAQQLCDELLKPKHQAINSIVQLYNLEGSIFKWANEGKDLVDSSGKKTVVAHPYNATWGKLLRHEVRGSE